MGAQPSDCRAVLFAWIVLALSTVSRFCSLKATLLCRGGSCEISRFDPEPSNPAGYFPELARHHRLLSVRMKRSLSEAASEAFVGSRSELVASTSNFGLARSTKTSPD